MSNLAQFFNKKILVQRNHYQTPLKKDTLILAVTTTGSFDVAFFPTPDTNSALPKNFTFSVYKDFDIITLESFSIPPLRIAITSSDGCTESRTFPSED